MAMAELGGLGERYVASCEIGAMRSVRSVRSSYVSIEHGLNERRLDHSAKIELCLSTRESIFLV